jgi:hypothetical protein
VSAFAGIASDGGKQRARSRLQLPRDQHRGRRIQLSRRRLTPENQYQNDYQVSRGWTDKNYAMTQIARGFSIVPSDHPLFGKPKRQYVEADAFSSLRCLDQACAKVVATKSDGQEIQVDQFNLEYTLAGNPMSYNS